jgi:hypothetical protein
MNGASDAAVLARASAERRIIITSNGIGFRKLGRRTPDHPGLVVLLSSAGRSQQIELGQILAQAIDSKIVSFVRPDGRRFEIDATGVVSDHALP